jgi:DNA repair protein SbcD/Mre11
MLKIIHTADWHLGVRLHKKDLAKDHQLFFDWLISTIKEKQVDVLLVSGDIFDHANPSQEAQGLYFDVLYRLKETGCKVILTAGNHDSPAVLDLTKKFLKIMDIHVVGMIGNEPAEQVICLKKKQLLPNANQEKTGDAGNILTGQVEAVVCAAPYLRDADIRLAAEGELQQEKQQKRKSGMMQHFSGLIDRCAEYGDVPIILMAHLFAAGAEINEQKRDITIGGLDAFLSTDFPKGCHYVALGHIHRPMQIGGTNHIRYSGSPIALSFSEKEQKKIVVEITVDNGCIDNIQPLEVPMNRKLLKFTGTFNEVEKQLKQYKNEYSLKAFAEIEIIEPEKDLDLPLKMHKLVTEHDASEVEILTYKYSSITGIGGLKDRVEENVEISELQETEVLEKMMDAQNISGDQREMINKAFDELIRLIEREDANQ